MFDIKPRFKESLADKAIDDKIVEISFQYSTMGRCFIIKISTPMICEIMTHDKIIRWVLLLGCARGGPCGAERSPTSRRGAPSRGAERSIALGAST